MTALVVWSVIGWTVAGAGWGLFGWALRKWRDEEDYSDRLLKHWNDRELEIAASRAPPPLIDDEGGVVVPFKGKVS